jgi:hypothetical protein
MVDQATHFVCVCVCCRKELEQREKDAEEFYKSDSDDSGTNICSPFTIIDSTDSINSCALMTNDSTKILNNNSASDCNNLISEIGTHDTSKTLEVGMSTVDSKILISDSSSGVDVASSGASVPFSHTAMYMQDTDAGCSVASADTKDMSSTQSAGSNCEVEIGQSRTAADSCDFQLHYSESQSEDVAGPVLITHSALNDDESNALDVCLQAANTEDLVLHYTESSLPGAEEEPQKQEKTALWENLLLPLASGGDGVDNKATTVLQSLAQRSLPGLGDITKLKPHLSGTPNGVIELDEKEPSPAGVLKLVERFMKHSAVKWPPQKHTVEVGYVCQSQIILLP